jgi:hypothetical protein
LRKIFAQHQTNCLSIAHSNFLHAFCFAKRFKSIALLTKRDRYIKRTRISETLKGKRALCENNIYRYDLIRITRHSHLLHCFHTHIRFIKIPIRIVRAVSGGIYKWFSVTYLLVIYVPTDKINDRTRDGRLCAVGESTHTYEYEPCQQWKAAPKKYVPTNSSYILSQKVKNLSLYNSKFKKKTKTKF